MRLLTALFLTLSSASVNAQQSYLVDWEEVGEESIDHHVNLIRINISNSPGNETEVVDYLWNVLIDVAAAR